MLFGEANDVQETFNAEIVSISDRIATAFASLKVTNFPAGVFKPVIARIAQKECFLALTSTTSPVSGDKQC